MDYCLGRTSYMEWGGQYTKLMDGRRANIDSPEPILAATAALSTLMSEVANTAAKS